MATGLGRLYDDSTPTKKVKTNGMFGRVVGAEMQLAPSMRPEPTSGVTMDDGDDEYSLPTRATPWWFSLVCSIGVTSIVLILVWILR